MLFELIFLPYVYFRFSDFLKEFRGNPFLTSCFKKIECYVEIYYLYFVFLAKLKFRFKFAIHFHSIVRFLKMQVLYCQPRFNRQIRKFEN